MLFNLVWEGEGDNPHPKAKARSCWYAAGKGSKTRSRERSRLQRAGPAHEEGSTDVDLDPWNPSEAEFCPGFWLWL